MGLQDTLKKVNPKFVPVIFIVASLLVGGGFYYNIYMPKSEEIAQLEDQVATLNTKVDQAKVKARKLDEVKKAAAKLEVELNKAKVILPGEKNTHEFIDDGLEEILGDAGLEVKEVKKVSEQALADNLYKEFKVSVKADGSFHEMGAFMEEMDSSERLLRVSRLNMSSARLTGKEMTIPSDFDLIIYSAVAEEAKK